jgi:hypothetical protein
MPVGDKLRLEHTVGAEKIGDDWMATDALTGRLDAVEATKERFGPAVERQVRLPAQERRHQLLDRAPHFPCRQRGPPDDADQRELMVREAIEKLARTRVHSDRKGRPPRKWTQEELETIEWHWRSLGHETNEEAIAAMRAEGIKRISVSIVSKRFGPSGRDKIKRK